MFVNIFVVVESSIFVWLFLFKYLAIAYFLWHLKTFHCIRYFRVHICCLTCVSYWYSLLSLHQRNSPFICTEERTAELKKTHSQHLNWPESTKNRFIFFFSDSSNGRIRVCQQFSYFYFKQKSPIFCIFSSMAFQWTFRLVLIQLVESCCCFSLLLSHFCRMKFVFHEIHFIFLLLFESLAKLLIHFT